ncbi:hypothetical protein Rsub_09474 [Raphidocelis subcapitata]|uniref:Arrestin-like N-terminal domain-containing protein n=1 Tax=Raphidocelis subcapitata TaxID=307507 RepID=A0A2V0PCQ8_9CHLO|nr:hypothetical protein Rsub_09474 [Raphidocelis subcapitata]|eukprot:GBF96732.1 hypothetical protein Rsub_09474 [Raphidocelis subcapitata]
MSAQIQVRLDSPTAWAGDVVRGKVFVYSPSRPVEYNDLYVEFHGKEDNWWQEIGFQGNYETGGDTMRDDYRVWSYTNDIIKARLPLVQPGPGVLKPGSYEFPFSFATPRGLPGSMTFHSMDARGFVEYSVRAKAEQSGFLSSGIRASAPLRVLQRVPRPPAPLRAQTAAELTSGCCCFKASEGAVAMRLEAAADLHCPGRSRGVTFSAMIENRARSASITSVEASLVKVVAFQTNRGNPGFRDTAVLARTKLRLPPAPGGRPAVAPGTSAAFRNVTLPLRPDADPSVDGQLVKVWYELRLEAGADGGMFMSRPTLSPKIVLCLDPAAAAPAAPAPPAASKPAPAKPAPPAPPKLAPAPVAPPAGGDAEADGPAWDLPPDWRPQKYEESAYALSLDHSDSARRVTMPEIEALAAAALADDADAYAAIPSAPPAPEDDEGAIAELDVAPAPAAGGAGGGGLPHGAGWL